MSFPQLKTRTEYSFRRCFGPVGDVAARLAEIGTPAAGIVDDNGTWGHVQWEKALLAAGIEPMFGASFPMKLDDGTRPSMWVLATDRAAFYRLTSLGPTTPSELAAATGAVRFSGGVLEDPTAVDYVDLTPRSATEARRRLAFAREHGLPTVLVSDNDFPGPDDEEKFLAWDDSKKPTPQHILAEGELREAFWFLDDEEFAAAYRGTFEAAEAARGVRLEAAPIISVEGDLRAWVEEGRQQRLAAGQIPEWTEDYQARLDRELDMIEEKAYQSYFLVVADLVKWAKKHMLVGPARGSSAGSLVCYLLEITEVDPLVHGLIFERFIDVNRDDLPDIDIDFNDQKRELVFEYLAERYGAENVARIGSVNRLKPRSVMAHVGKKLGIPTGATFSVLNVLVEHSSGDARYGKSLEDTMEGTQPGKDFAARYPEADLMWDLENHASHTGVHAAGIIVANVPVVEYCTVRDGIAQVDKKDAEYINLLKIDALGLRTLGVIEDTGCVTNEELYSLGFDDPEVLRVFDEAKFSGVFQFEGAAQRRVSTQVPMTDFKKIDHVTALARPGPLGGGAAQHYIERNAGHEEVTYRHPSMADYLGDTMGVVLYQEQVMRIVRELGKFSWSETSVIRKAMSGRKGEEFFNQRGAKFVEGAATLGIDEATARQIWEEICSFGAWGMNKSHTTSYAMISYWCAYMKRWHPVEYAAACLRNAKDDEQTVEILREMTSEGVPFTPFDPHLSGETWRAVDGRLVGGFQNLVGVGPVKARAWIEKRETDGLTDADLEKIGKHKVKNEDLSPAHTLWGDIYRNPSEYNVHGPVREFADLRDKENAVVICKLVRRDRRDKNESVLVNKRGGKIHPGQSLFLDMFCVDDTAAKPVRLRINPRDWNRIGEKAADRAVDGQDWFLVRGLWLDQFSMMIVEKIKCLTNPEMFL